MAELQVNGTGIGRAPNKLVEQVIRTPDRRPSPQPTLLGVPGASNSNQSLHKILPSDGSGYVAPKFEGKQNQMAEGMCSPDRLQGLLR